jgi:hypothetical protein
LTGPWYAFVRTDRGDHVVEYDAEGNNLLHDAEPLFVSLAPPVDLVAGVVTVSPTASVGSTVELSYTIHNDGDTAAFGAWTDRLYLSRDETYSPDDVRFVSRRRQVFIPPFDLPIPCRREPELRV